MLNNLEHINWSELRQAHGDAGHVPTALKGLISSDETEQEASYWKLDNHVVLQGDLYESAFYVIPFLLELLESGITNGRNYVYDLLFEIANGYAAEEVSCNYQGESLDLTEACKRSVLTGINLYLNEVANIGSESRENALDLIVSLESSSNDILSRLMQILDDEKDSDFRDHLNEAISELSSNVN